VTSLVELLWKQWSLMEEQEFDIFHVKMDRLPKYFVCQWIVGIQPTTDLHFFYCQSCSFSRPSILGLQINEDLFCNKVLECIFLYLSSFFNILVPPDCSFLIIPPSSAAFAQSIEQLNQWSLIWTMIIPSRCPQIYLKVAWTLLLYWMKIEDKVLKKWLKSQCSYIDSTDSL